MMLEVNGLSLFPRPGFGATEGLVPSWSEDANQASGRTFTFAELGVLGHSFDSAKVGKLQPSGAEQSDHRLADSNVVAPAPPLGPATAAQLLVLQSAFRDAAAFEIEDTQGPVAAGIRPAAPNAPADPAALSALPLAEPPLPDTPVRSPIVVVTPEAPEPMKVAGTSEVAPPEPITPAMQSAEAPGPQVVLIETTKGLRARLIGQTLSDTELEVIDAKARSILGEFGVTRLSLSAIRKS